MNIKKLEKLRRELRDVEREISLADSASGVKFTRERFEELSKSRKRLMKILSLHDPDFIWVTDHAIIRYLERVHDIDMNEVKDMIIKGREEMIKGMKSGKFPMGDGVKMVVKNKTIITVY